MRGFVPSILIFTLLMMDPFFDKATAQYKYYFKEISRACSPDSSRLIFKFHYGPFPGDDVAQHIYYAKIINAKDKLPTSNVNALYFGTGESHRAYWKGNDTVMIEENFVKYISDGISAFLKSSFTMNGVQVVITQKDPIDSSYTQKILFRERSPSKKF